MGDVFDEMERMSEQMNEIFGGMLMPAQALIARPQHKQLCAMPRSALADVKETATSVVAAFEIPGIDKKDIEINLTEDSLEVKAYKELSCKTKDKEECRSIRFYRNIALPSKVVPSGAKASYTNGILRVEAAKTKETQKVKVEID